MAERKNGRVELKDMEAVRFVPLVGSRKLDLGASEPG